MSEWRWFTHERVRFGDCDPMGHANNAVYSTYLEQARITALGGLDPFILARVEIDFRAELHADDAIEIRTRCSRVGTKSFELSYELHAGGRLVAEAKSVLVGYDYEREASTEIPERWKRRLSE